MSNDVLLLPFFLQLLLKSDIKLWLYTLSVLFLFFHCAMVLFCPGVSQTLGYNGISRQDEATTSDITSWQRWRCAVRWVDRLG